jgi:hypothetical protein
MRKIKCFREYLVNFKKKHACSDNVYIVGDKNRHHEINEFNGSYFSREDADFPTRQSIFPQQVSEYH